MKRFFCCVIVAVCGLALSSCSVTLPRNPTSLLRQKYSALTVYSNVNIYRFNTYTIIDSNIKGLSQTYKRGTETLSKAVLDDNFPPINRTLGLKDILRIDAEDSYNEPAIDTSLYLILPAIVVLFVLVPIVVGGNP